MGLSAAGCNLFPQVVLPKGQCNPNVDNSWVYGNFFDNQFTLKRLPDGRVETERIFPTASPYEIARNSKEGDYLFEGRKRNGTPIFTHRFNFDKDGKATVSSPAMPKMERIRIYGDDCKVLSDEELPLRFRN